MKVWERDQSEVHVFNQWSRVDDVRTKYDGLHIIYTSEMHDIVGASLIE